MCVCVCVCVCVVSACVRECAFSGCSFWQGYVVESRSGHCMICVYCGMKDETDDQELSFAGIVSKNREGEDCMDGGGIVEG